MYRRTFVLGASLLISAVLAACGGDDDDPDSTPGTGGKPVGGEVTVQHDQFSSLDPHAAWASTDVSQLSMVFRGLYRFDVDDKLVPELAAAMPEISEDGKTYTIKIKPNLTWSDGDPLTADDFVAGFQRTCNPDVQAAYSASLANITGCADYVAAAEATAAEKEALLEGVGVRKVDDTTIEISLERPQATFASQLALWFSWPVPVHIVAAPGDEWPTDPMKLAYNGPFKVESFTDSEQLALVRNENYGGNHAAYLDKITLRYIGDAEAANNAFRSGELKLVQANGAALDTLRSDAELSELLYAPESSGANMALAMNMGSEVLSNDDFRRALSQATDREALVRIVYKEAHRPTTSWIPESMIGVDDDPFSDAVGYDTEAAKQSLEESGVGKDVDLTLSILDSPEFRDAAAFLQEQWKQILGIEVNVEVADRAAIRAAIGEKTYDVIFLGWNQDYPDPETWVDGLFQSDGMNNVTGCDNPQIDELMEEAKVEMDSEERKAHYVELNRLISEELCGVVPLYQARSYYLTAAELKGPREFSTSQNRFLSGDWAVEEWYLSE